MHDIDLYYREKSIFCKFKIQISLVKSWLLEFLYRFHVIHAWLDYFRVIQIGVAEVCTPRFYSILCFLYCFFMCLALWLKMAQQTGQFNPEPFSISENTICCSGFWSGWKRWLYKKCIYVFWWPQYQYIAIQILWVENARERTKHRKHRYVPTDNK